MPNSLGDRFSEKAEALVGAPNDFDSLTICQSVENLAIHAVQFQKNEKTKHMKAITDIVYSAIALFAFACLALSPTVRAVNPPPDGDNGSLQVFYTGTLSFFGLGACTTPPPNMVGWYPGDGNADDISVTGNNGTLQGGATFAAGMVKPAFSLNGTDAYVQAAADAAQDQPRVGARMHGFTSTRRRRLPGTRWRSLARAGPAPTSICRPMKTIASAFTSRPEIPQHQLQ